MKPAWKWLGVGVWVVTVALWFFGGMNLGGTATAPDARKAGWEGGGVQASGGWDFRPGPGFLLLGLVIGGGCLVMSRDRSSPAGSQGP
jgi:hypothetical protein